MNEKIKKVGITVKEKVTEFVKEEPEIVAAGLAAGGMLFAYTLGMKTGRFETAHLIGAMLGIYPKDATVGQFIEDIGKMRE